MWLEFNNNPLARRVDDCAVRAVSKALNMSWEAAYISLAVNGMQMGDIMSGNSVIGATLRNNGFRKANIPNTCPDCYTVRQFAEDNPTGTYVLGTDGHVVCVDGGAYYDTYDSGDLVPLYVWYENVNPRFPE